MIGGDWHRRSAMLAVFYLLALAYAAIYPLHFVRAYWDFVWSHFPVLPEQLFPGTPWLLSVSIAVAVLPAMMLAAAWLGVSWRIGRRFWLRVLLLWLALSGVLLGIVVVQLLFLESLLPRLDPRALPLGVLLGLLLWLLSGRYLMALMYGLSSALLRLGGLPASLWQLRWMVSLLVWWLWFLAGRWAWPVAGEALWTPGPWPWWWVVAWLALFGFTAAATGRGGRLSVARMLLSWLGLSLIAVACLMFGDWWQSGRVSVGMDLRLVAQQGGILTGLLAALVLAVARPLLLPLSGLCRPRCRHLLVMWAAALMVAVAMLPLDADLRLVDIGQARPGLSVRLLVQQLYQLIKDAMLWLPVGFIYAIGGRQRLMWAWLAALCGGLLLVLLPWFALWPLGLPADIGMAWAGLLSGVWLARVSQSAVAVGGGAADREASVEVSSSGSGSGSGSGSRESAAERPVVAVPVAPLKSLETARSNQFRRRQQSDGDAGNMAAKTAWRTRAAEDEPANSGRRGFRPRSAAPDKPSLNAEDDV